MKNKSFLFLLIFFSSFCLIIGCDSDGIHEDNTYIVATDATLAPMSFMSAGNEIIGFEPDLVKAIAKRAGFNIRITNVEWAGLFGGLITNKFDLVISSVTVLEERKKRMDFSIPYLKSGLALVVHKNQKQIMSFEDAKNFNAMIGAQLGTTSYYFLEKEPSIKTQGYQMYGHAINDLINGKLDAVLGESSGTLFYKNTPLFQQLKVVGEILSDEFYAVVLRKGEGKLMTQVNLALKSLIKDGTVARLHHKWDLGQVAKVPN